MKLVNVLLLLPFLIQLEYRETSHVKLINHIKIFINKKNFIIQDYIENILYCFLLNIYTIKKCRKTQLHVLCKSQINSSITIY